MGFLIAAVLFICGGFILVDSFMMAGSVGNIMQQDYVQARLIGGATILALAAILWVLSGIAESLAKMTKLGASVAAPVQQPVAPAAAAHQPAPARPAPTTSGWQCAECGKVNPPMSPVCACGNLRA